MKRNRGTVFSTFFITVIMLFAWIGCLVADANTARMTFGHTSQTVVKEEMRLVPEWMLPYIPTGLRAVGWWLQLERDTMIYWFQNVDFQ